MEFTPNKEEQEFIRALARWFKENKGFAKRESVMLELGLAADEYEVLMRKMDAMGFVEQVTTTSGGYAHWFRPSASAVQAVREMDEQARKAKVPPDIIAEARSWARRKPYVAWSIVALVVLTFLVQLINGVLEFLDRWGND